MTTTPIPEDAFAGHRVGNTTRHLCKPGRNAARGMTVILCTGRAMRDVWPADPDDETLTDCGSCSNRFGDVRTAAR